MTTVISRLYETAEAAMAVERDLRAAGFPQNAIDVIEYGSPFERIREARVGEATAQTLAEHLTSGRALLVIRAPFTPFGAALRAQQIVAGHPHIDLGAGVGDEYIREELRIPANDKILRNRRFLSNDFIPGRTSRRLLSERLNIPTLTQRRAPGRSLIKGGPVTSGAFPFRLLLDERAVSGPGETILSRLISGMRAR
ncbi:MAG: hypothetical protein AAGA87_05765 [Pseudomonadota bacterium]